MQGNNRQEIISERWVYGSFPVSDDGSEPLPVLFEPVLAGGCQCGAAMASLSNFELIFRRAALAASLSI